MSKIVFELEVKDAQVVSALERQREALRRYRTELRGVDEGSEKFRDLAGKIGQTKQEIARLTTEQKQLNREFSVLRVPADSLAGLRLQYARLTEQVTNLNKVEREGARGQRIIADAAAVKKQIDGIEQSLGRFTGNVGNYRSILSGVGDFITGGLVTGGAVVGIEKLTEAIQFGIKVSGEYSNKLQEISALTGATGKQLEQLQGVENELRNIDVGGQKIVNTGTDILNALKLVGGARPELLKDSAALGEVARQAIILAEAAGDGLQPNVEALTTTLGQFQLPASNAARVANELAAGAKEGSAEIPQITSALKEFGSVAKISNVTTSESVALIETLAARQLKGAEAGTQLRNVLAKIAAADILPKPAQEQFKQLGININILKDQTIPFEERLRELGKAQGDVAALTKIFGLENLQAATILTDSIPQYVELQSKIEGTNEAQKQAAIRAADSQTAWDNLSNAIENKYIDTFNKLGGSFSFVASGLTSMVEKTDVFDTILNAAGPLLSNLSGLFSILEASSKPGVNAKQFGDDFFYLGEGIISAAQAANQSGQYVRAIAQDADQGAKDLATLKEIIGDDDGKTKKGTQEIKAAAGSLEFLRKKVQEAQDQLNKAAPNKLEGAVELLKQAELELRKLEFQVANIGDGGAFNPLSELPSKAFEIPIVITTNLEADAKANVEQNIKDVFEQVKTNAKQGQAEINASIAADSEKAQKNREDQRKAIQGAAIDGAAQVANSILQIQANAAEREKEKKLETLNTEYEKRKEAAQGNAALLEQIDKEFNAKREAIEKDAARKRRRLAIIEATINGAVAVTKALTGAVPPLNFILAGIASVAAAAQIAVIASQKFAKGGAVKMGTFGGKSHASGGTKGVFEDGTRVEVEKDEDFIILNKRASAARRRLSNLNYAYGGRKFADGGSLGFTPQIAIPSPSGAANMVVVQSTAEFSDDQIRLMAAEIARQTADASRTAIASGLNDNNRTAERQAILDQQRAA